MPTRFLDKHRRAKRASRRLHLVFWLGALVSYLCYLIIIVPLFIFMAALFITPNATGPDAGLNNLMMLVLFGVAVIAVFLPVFKLLKAYNGRKRELGQQSAGEQAEALGGSPARADDDPLENRYVNLVAELSLAAGIPTPAAYVLRDDDSINAFALSGAGDSLALAVSRGALDNLTRDELQAVLGHEFGHIENGDPALYNRLSAMLAGYFATGSRKEQERLYTDPDTQVLSLSGLSDSAEKDQFGINISILYLYGRLLQAAFARRREAMADARAVQYTRDPVALIGALQKAWALQQQGIHPRRPPPDRAHIYFINYRHPGWRRLRTHPTLRERIRTWGGNISDADLPAILARINACRSSRAATPLRPVAPPPEPNPAYPLAAYDRLLAAELRPAPTDPAAALLAIFAYHSGTALADLERAGLLPSERLFTCRRAYDTIAQSEPLLRLALTAHLSRTAFAFDIAEKQRLDPIIRHLIEHDGQLSRYELAAFIAWRATCITGRGADYRAHEADIAWLYNFLACDDPDDPNPQATYEDLLEVSALPLGQTPAWQPLDTGSSKTGLQLCHHCEALRRLAPIFRRYLLITLNLHYRSKAEITLQQAYLRFALQQILTGPPPPQKRQRGINIGFLRRIGFSPPSRT